MRGLSKKDKVAGYDGLRAERDALATYAWHVVNGHAPDAVEQYSDDGGTARGPAPPSQAQVESPKEWRTHMRINCHMGEMVHHLADGRVRHFVPQGPVYLSGKGGRKVDARRANPLTPLGQGGYFARIMVGLNVGQHTKYKIDDVIRIVWETREAQGASPDASIVAQNGIYRDKAGERVIEPSAQVIVINYPAVPNEKFEEQMGAVAEALCRQLEQEFVILEIQNRGVVVAAYSVTP